MTEVSAGLSPPQRLAVAYATRRFREPLALLLRVDSRLADIVGRSTEPMIAQIKMAWWYDAIASDMAKRPKGEPVFQMLGQLAMPELDDAIKILIDAWSGLLAAETWEDAVLSDFARDRSQAIFGTYARWVGSEEDVSATGKPWAFCDLKSRFGEKAACANVSPSLLASRQLRPLSILALSVTNPSAGKMLWHALTGR